VLFFFFLFFFPLQKREIRNALPLLLSLFWLFSFFSFFGRHAEIALLLPWVEE